MNCKPDAVQIVSLNKECRNKTLDIYTLLSRTWHILATLLIPRRSLQRMKDLIPLLEDKSSMRKLRKVVFVVY